MLDYLNTIISCFGKFVKMLFELPFYGGISWGYMLLTLYIIAVLFIFLGGHYK